MRLDGTESEFLEINQVYRALKSHFRENKVDKFVSRHGCMFKFLAISNFYLEWLVGGYDK